MDYSAPAAASVAKPAAQRNVVLDSMRVIMSCMVVGLHAHLLVESHPEISNALENYLFRIAVPMFLLINGYFLFQLLQRGGSPAKWALRIFTLYVTWTLVYSFFIFKEGLGAGLKLLILGYWHLWYLPATLLAGGLMYVLRARRAGSLLPLFAVLYVTGLAVMYAGNYHLFTGAIDAAINKTYTHRNFLFVGLPMLGLGFLAAREKWGHGRSASWLAGALAGGVLVMVLEWAVNQSLGMEKSQGLDASLALPFVCLPLFLLALRAPAVPLRLDLAGVAAVVYFAHPLFLLMLPATSTAALVGASILGCLVAYPLVAALNRRWPVFI